MLATVEIDPKTKRARVCPGVKIYNGRSPTFDHDTGKAYPGMYPNTYYVSANPEHIATANRKAAAAARREAAADAKRASLVIRAYPIAEFLAYDETQEVAESLASRLSPAQIKIIADWLGV